MPWGYAAIAVGTIVAGNQQKKGAEAGAKAGESAAMAGVAEQQAARREYQTNIAPYLQSGTGALSGLQRLNAGDYSGFLQSPDYQFQLDQGLEGLDRSATARGAVNSGGMDADRLRFSQGLASQSYGDYYNRLYNLAAMGQNAAAGAGTASMQSANSISSLLGQAGQARAAGAIGGANAYGNTIAQLGQLGGQMWGNRQTNYPQNLSSQGVSYGSNQGSMSGFGSEIGGFMGGGYG